MKKVGLFFGGPSDEHEVSITSAVNVAKNIDTQKYETVLIYWSKDGEFFATLSKEKVFHSNGLSFLYHVKVFSFKTKSLVVETKFDRNVLLGAFSNDSKLFHIEAESWDKNRISRIINLKTKKTVLSMKHEKNGGLGKFSPSGEFFLFKQKKYLMIVDLKKARVISKIKLLLQSDDFGFSPNGSYFYISNKKATSLFTMLKRKLVVRIKQINKPVKIKFLNHSNSLVLAFLHGQITLFDIDGKKTVKSLSAKGKILSLEVNANDAYLGVQSEIVRNDESQREYHVFSLTNEETGISLNLDTLEKSIRFSKTGGFLMTSTLSEIDREYEESFNLIRLYDLKTKKFSFVELNKEKQNYVYLSEKNIFLAQIFGRNAELKKVVLE